MFIRNWPSGPRSRTRVSKVAFVFLIWGLLLVSEGQTYTAAAQAVKASTTGGPVLHSRDEGSLRIGIGDVVQVSVFDTPELSGKLRVNADGTVKLPVSGSTVVAGLSPREAADVF